MPLNIQKKISSQIVENNCFLLIQFFNIGFSFGSFKHLKNFLENYLYKFQKQTIFTNFS